MSSGSAHRRRVCLPMPWARRWDRRGLPAQAGLAAEQGPHNRPRRWHAGVLADRVRPSPPTSALRSAANQSSAPTRHLYRAQQVLLQELIPRLRSVTRAFAESLAQCCRAHGAGQVTSAMPAVWPMNSTPHSTMANASSRSMTPTKRSPPPTHRVRVERLRLQRGSRARHAGAPGTGGAIRVRS